VPVKPNNYPEPSAHVVAGRAKWALEECFGLSNFEVNLTRLSSGARTALQHRRSKQNEFIYALGASRVAAAPNP
jgi:uncharacterized cupin superfamily protein